MNVCLNGEGGLVKRCVSFVRHVKKANILMEFIFGKKTSLFLFSILAFILKKTHKFYGNIYEW